jgi:hypothetical protein
MLTPPLVVESSTRGPPPFSLPSSRRRLRSPTTSRARPSSTRTPPLVTRASTSSLAVPGNGDSHASVHRLGPDTLLRHVHEAQRHAAVGGGRLDVTRQGVSLDAPVHGGCRDAFGTALRSMPPLVVRASTRIDGGTRRTYLTSWPVFIPPLGPLVSSRTASGVTCSWISIFCSRSRAASSVEAFAIRSALTSTVLPGPPPRRSSR